MSDGPGANEPGADGPDADAIAAWIVERYPDVAVASAGGGRFFSCDADKHWPNLATIVTTDDFDQVSDLSRDGVFRLNIGVSRATFDERLGPGALEAEHDYTALDTLLPHPVYGRQHWLSILNPSAATFATVVTPLLDEAHAIVANATRASSSARRRPQRTPRPRSPGPRRTGGRGASAPGSASRR